MITYSGSCRGLKRSGILLRLPCRTITTALIFLHRLHQTDSPLCHDELLSISAALLVAAKVDEVFVSMNNLLNAVTYAITPHTEDPKFCVGNVYYRHKEQLLWAEQLLLRLLRFDVCVDSPYECCFRMCSLVNASKATARVAVLLLNDCLEFSGLCALHSASHIAAAALYVSHCLTTNKFDLLQWQKVLDVQLSHMELIGLELLGMLTHSTI